MNLLLFLSAILSALTGAVGSSRAAVTPAVAACAVVASETEVAAVRPAAYRYSAQRAALPLVIDRAAFTLAPLIAVYRDRPRE